MSDPKLGLGDRMKRHEQAAHVVLPPRHPCIVRVDGKAFHTFTRGMEKPWDRRLFDAMCKAATYVCGEASGAKLAYLQSDECSFLLTDYDANGTQPWFDYDVQKLASVTASLFTAAFLWEAIRAELLAVHGGLPAFDARCFVLPREEVVNYFVWRQKDAERNSVSGLAQAHFSHKSLHGLKSNQMQDRLMLEKGINWNDCDPWQKRGACVVREVYDGTGPNGEPCVRSRWIVDWATPIFTQDRTYIQRLVDCDRAESEPARTPDEAMDPGGDFPAPAWKPK